MPNEISERPASISAKHGLCVLALLGALGAPSLAWSQEQPGVALPHPPALRDFYQSICGPKDDSQEVELYDGSFPDIPQKYVADNERSTLQLQWNSRDAIKAALPGFDVGNVADERWCTGTLVSDRHVLTAGHCVVTQKGEHGWTTPFRPAQGGKEATFVPPEQLAPLMHANFNYQTEGATHFLRKPDVYPVKALLEWRLESEAGTNPNPQSLDYAIIELGPDSSGNLPGTKYAPAQLLISDPAPSTAIAIIQHPEGHPKRIDAGHQVRVAGSKIFYGDLDTLGGSSGAGIRNADGAVVGVHTNGGCTAVGGENFGTRNEAIAAVSKVLSELAKK